MNTVVVERINLESDQRRSRASTTVNGFDTWFETSDLLLRPSTEGFASAFVIPCLLQQLPLSVKPVVCSLWHKNVSELTKLLTDSWGIEPSYPSACELENRGDDLAHGKPRAQFFSGGVDSFYSLLTATQPVEHLVTVQGFDIELHDSFRFEHLKRSLQAVAGQVGAQPWVVRTNVRQHPIIASVTWDDAHGGALAAVGHLLSNQIGEIVIPPSWAKKNFHSLWGTHWRLDHLWSSSALSIAHGDASLSRAERIRTIACQPLVQNHLRVCFENRTAYGNCSRCPKCVRTMAVLHDCGQLHNFPVFDTSVPIWQRIDELPYVTRTASFDELLERGVEPKLESAIRRLLKRRVAVLDNAETVKVQNGYLSTHNQQLLDANLALDKELRRLQEEIAAMASSRIWQAGSILRRCKNILLSSRLTAAESSEMKVES